MIKLKIIEDLSVSDGDLECVTVEIENKNSKYVLITCCYRPPSGDIKGVNSLENIDLENIFQKTNRENKLCFVVGDFNLKFINLENLEIRTFCNRIFVHGCTPLITRQTRVTSKTVSLIDKIYSQILFLAPH